MKWWSPNKSLQFAPEYIPKVTANQVKDLIDAGYSRSGEAENIGKRYGLKLDKQLSNANHKIFIDKDKNVSVVYRGSKNENDAMTDGLLAIGLEKYSTRFRESKDLMNNINKKYNNKFVSSYGHSLGGSLAEYSGGDKIITVNKGVGIGGIGKKIKPNQTDIRTDHDLVSILSTTQSGGKSILIKTKEVNPLKEHSHHNIELLKNKIL